MHTVCCQFFMCPGCALNWHLTCRSAYEKAASEKIKMKCCPNPLCDNERLGFSLLGNGVPFTDAIRVHAKEEYTSFALKAKAYEVAKSFTKSAKEEQFDRKYFKDFSIEDFVKFEMNFEMKNKKETTYLSKILIDWMQLCGLKKGTELLYDVIELGVLWFCRLRGYLDENGKEKEMSNASAYKYLLEILIIGVPYPHVNTVETGEDYDDDETFQDVEFGELCLEMDLEKIFKILENGEELPDYINLCAITDQCLADLIRERLLRVTRDTRSHNTDDITVTPYSRTQALQEAFKTKLRFYDMLKGEENERIRLLLLQKGDARACHKKRQRRE